MIELDESSVQTRLTMELDRLRVEHEQLCEAQSQLERSRDEYLHLFELAPLPTLTFSRGGSIQAANRAAEQLLCEDGRRLKQRLFSRYVEPEDRDTFTLHLMQINGSGEAACCEIKLHAQGKVFPVKLCSQLTPGQNLIQTSIVDLRDRELELDEMRRLIESERRAREASQAKDQFIAMLSHELRTPLTPVLAAASAFHDQPDLSPELRRVFAMIRRNVGAEARLIDDLLDATGIVHKKVQVERRPLDVHRAALEAVDVLKVQAQSKQQTLHVDLTAQHHHVSGDSLRLRQVFSNLLQNAIKFTQPGGELSLRSWNGPQGVAIEVADNGPGIEPGLLHRLFEPFDRLHQNEHGSSGLGLGLAISKGLVELNGGRITAHSLGPGRGTRFVVELPTIPQPELDSSVEAAPPSARGASSGCRILLVEDHADTAEMMAALLEAHGYEVSPAATLEQARQADLEKVDVIISDLGLPDGSGIDLIKELQSNGRKPAIALSGYGMDADIQASKNAGFDLHLTKPIDLGRLVEAIQRLSPRSPVPTTSVAI